MPERRQYFLFAIFVCSAIEQSSRSLFSYLVNFAAETPSSSSAQPPHGDGSTYLYVNVDLGFDRVFYSVLSSYAFAIPFFVCSILAGPRPWINSAMRSSAHDCGSTVPRTFLPASAQ